MTWTRCRYCFDKMIRQRKDGRFYVHRAFGMECPGSGKSNPQIKTEMDERREARGASRDLEP